MTTTIATSSRARLRRAGWNVADQVLSAGTNVVVALLVARAVSATEFGAFAVAFLAFSIVVGVERSLVGTPLSIRHSHEEGVGRRRTAGRAMAAALAIALTSSTLALIASRVVGTALAPTLVALAIVLPALVLQDACRMAFFAWAQPARATANDAIWAVAQAAAIGAVIVTGHATAASLVAAWGAGAAMASAVGLWHLGLRPAPRTALAWPRPAWAWLAEHRRLGGYLVTEYAIGVGAFQGGLLAIGASLGLSDIGAVRAAQVLIGPLGIASTSAVTFGVPEVARLDALPRRVMRIALAASVALTAVAIAYTGALMAIPPGLGAALFGATWAGASLVLLPIAMGSVLASGKLGPVIFVYGRGQAQRTVRLVALLAMLALTGMAIGAATGGIVGLAWGMAIAQGLVVPLWFWQLRVVAREHAHA